MLSFQIYRKFISLKVSQEPNTNIKFIIINDGNIDNIQTLTTVDLECLG